MELDLSKLSDATAKQILLQLVTKGCITEENVKEAICKEPTAEIKRAVSFVHNVLCNGHASRDYCLFYAEEAADNCWEKEEHQDWLKRTLDLMQSLHVSTEEGLTMLYQKMMEVQTKILNLQEQTPGAYQLLLLVNGWNESS